MLGDSPMRRETLARLRDTGVRVFDFGVFRLQRGVDVSAFEPVLETAATLGARHACVNGDEPDPQALAGLLHELCELTRRYGIRVNLEPTPWTGIPTIASAADLAAVPPALIDVRRRGIEEAGAAAGSRGHVVDVALGDAAFRRAVVAFHRRADDPVAHRQRADAAGLEQAEKAHGADDSTVRQYWYFS